MPATSSPRHHIKSFPYAFDRFSTISKTRCLHRIIATKTDYIAGFLPSPRPLPKMSTYYRLRYYSITTSVCTYLDQGNVSTTGAVLSRATSTHDSTDSCSVIHHPSTGASRDSYGTVDISTGVLRASRLLPHLIPHASCVLPGRQKGVL